MFITKQTRLRNDEWYAENSKKFIKVLWVFLMFGVVLFFALVCAYLYLSIAHLSNQLEDYKKIVETISNEKLETIIRHNHCINVNDNKIEDPSFKTAFPDFGDSSSQSEEVDPKNNILTKRSAAYEDSGWMGVSQEPRPLRPMNPMKMGRVRPLPSAHFSGDTSRYVLGVHQHFHGNGRLRHLHKVYIDWKVDEWIESLGMEQYYAMNNGVVTIKDTGLYFIYAQIYYVDHHDANAYKVCKNEETVLQCANYIPTVNKTDKAHSCYTAGLAFLEENDKITIRDFHNNRFSLFEPGKSFFGFIKFGDSRAAQNALG